MSQDRGGTEFVVLNGEAAGSRILRPPGDATIGSEPSSQIRLVGLGVSRHHAQVTSLGERTILSDSASRNGTWVNGELIRSPTFLTTGDLVQLGELQLRFVQREASADVQSGSRSLRNGTKTIHNQTGNSEIPAGGPPATTQPSSSGKKGLGFALIFAGCISILGYAGNSLTAFLTELTPTWTWFIGPIIGLAVTLATEILNYYRKDSSSSPQQPVNNYHSRRRPVPRRPLAATLIIIALALGGGGWLVTTGVSYAIGYVSGNENGVPRLEQQVVQEVEGVTVTVLSVDSTPHFTRVEIRVDNETTNSLSLPFYQNVTLTAPDATTFDADAFRSNWKPEIAAGGSRKGTLNFESQLPQGATTVSLNFVSVFLHGFDGPASITVPGITLGPLR